MLLVCVLVAICLVCVAFVGPGEAKKAPQVEGSESPARKLAPDTSLACHEALADGTVVLGHKVKLQAFGDSARLAVRVFNSPSFLEENEVLLGAKFCRDSSRYAEN